MYEGYADKSSYNTVDVKSRGLLSCWKGLGFFNILANLNLFPCGRQGTSAIWDPQIINSELTVEIFHIGVLRPQRIYLVHHLSPVSHLHSFVLLWIPWKDECVYIKDKTVRPSDTGPLIWLTAGWLRCSSWKWIIFSRSWVALGVREGKHMQSRNPVL